MAKFQITTKVTFEELGSDHSNDYLQFSQFTIGELQKIQAGNTELQGGADQSGQEAAGAEMLELLKSKFIRGSIYDEASRQSVELESADIDDMPVPMLLKCISKLTGDIDQNLGSTSSG